MAEGQTAGEPGRSRVGAGVPAEALDAVLIERDLATLRERPAPADPSSAGCVVAIVALLALVFMPVFLRAASPSSDLVLAVGVALAVLVVGGGLVGVFGGGLPRGRLIAEVEEAIGELGEAFPDGDPRAMRKAAIRILDLYVVATGPTSMTTFDPEEVAERLGPALQYVVAVERTLLERGAIHPCFTEGEATKGTEGRE